MNRTHFTSASAAVSAYFLVVGLIMGAWAAEIPVAKLRLGGGAGLFGAALLFIAAGAIMAMPLGGALINRFGSRLMVTLSGLAYCVLYMGPVLAPTLPLFMVCGFAFGAALGLTDVAMNTQGLAIERLARKPLMSRLHGMYSVGCLLGAFSGGVLIESMGNIAQVAVLILVCLAILWIASRFLLPGAVDKGLSTSHFALPTRATLGLGALCFMTLLVEGAFTDWSGIYLHHELAVDTGAAAAGFGLFSGGMAISRFLGDRVRTLIGSVHMVRSSALLTFVGLIGALQAQDPLLAVGMFALAGIGIGNLAPILFAGGGRMEPKAPGRGIAAVTTLGYSGMLAGPPLIGFLADGVGLKLALWSLAVMMFIVMAGARMVEKLDL